MSSLNDEKKIAIEWSAEIPQANEAIEEAVNAHIDYVLFCDGVIGASEPKITEAMISRAEAFEKNGFVESWENGLLLCKIELFRRYGLLDESCTDLYGAVACYMQQANDFGYSLVGVCGELSNSFIPGVGLREKLKAASLEKRDKPRILFEFTEMPALFCGTSEFQLAALKYFHECFSDKYEFFIRCNEDAIFFHQLRDRFESVFDEESQDIPICDIAFVASQPVVERQQAFINEHALRSVYTMLDCISLRTEYIAERIPRIRDIVRAGLRYADGIVAISDFSCQDYKQYFALDPSIASKSCRRVYIATDFGENVSSASEIDGAPFDDFVLVVGNPYKHKALKEVLEVARDDSHNYIFVGMAEDCLEAPNVYSYKNSHLSEEFLDGLYEACACVVFPSQYEGFGLPVTIALKHKKPVVLCDNAMNRELHSWFSEHRTAFVFFEKFSDIPSAVEHASSLSLSLPDFRHSWKEAIEDIEDYLSALLADAPNWSLIDERMWFYRYLDIERKRYFDQGKESVGIKNLLRERAQMMVRR